MLNALNKNKIENLIFIFFRLKYVSSKRKTTYFNLIIRFKCNQEIPYNIVTLYYDSATVCEDVMAIFKCFSDVILPPICEVTVWLLCENSTFVTILSPIGWLACTRTRHKFIVFHFIFWKLYTKQNHAWGECIDFRWTRCDFVVMAGFYFICNLYLY